MINPKTKTLPRGVDYTKDGTWGISANADRGTPPWVGGRTAKSPGKETEEANPETVSSWKPRQERGGVFIFFFEKSPSQIH